MTMFLMSLNSGLTWMLMEKGSGEMKTLDELGIKSLDTNFTGSKGDKTDSFGNDLSMEGSFTREVNGTLTEGKMTDVLFVNSDAEFQTFDDVINSLSEDLTEHEEFVGIHNEIATDMRVELYGEDDPRGNNAGNNQVNKANQVGQNNFDNAVEKQLENEWQVQLLNNDKDLRVGD